MKEVAFYQKMQEGTAEAVLDIADDTFRVHFSETDDGWEVDGIRTSNQTYDFNKNIYRPPENIRRLFEGLSAGIVIFQEEMDEKVPHPLPEMNY